MVAGLEVWTGSLLVGQWTGQRGQRESTPDTLPKPGPGPGCLWRPHPGLLTQRLHLLQAVTNSSAHHHSCGLPAPACPQAPPSLIPPSLLPFPLSGTTVHNPISPSSPLPQHSHLPFLIQCQQLVSEQSQIKQMCVGLAGTWQRAPCPAPSPIRALSQLVGVWVPPFQDPYLHPSRAWVRKCSDAFAFWPFLCLFSCNPLFLSLTAAFLPLLYCLSFVLFFILKNSASLIKLMRLLRITLEKKKKKATTPSFKTGFKVQILKDSQRHHNRPETNQKKNNRWSFFTAARPGSSRCHFLPSFLSQWHAKFMVILRSRYPCKQMSLIFLYNWLILLTPTYLSKWGWVKKSSN